MSASSEVPSNPGDLGRRVAARRQALGLSIEEVARRAGMHPDYLDYVERHARAQPNPAACARLAGALETSVAWLRGAGVDLPPGHARPAAATPRLLELNRDRCLERLEPGGIGRAVFVEERRVAALPVNFKMLDGAIVFRTSNGSIARAVREGSPFSVEVDHLDEALGEGWSVLVSGRAELISDPNVLAKVDALGLEPWAGGDRHVVVRLTPRAITGREIRRPQATD